MTKKNRKAALLIVLGLLLALAVPAALSLWPTAEKTRLITLEAAKYGYNPPRIIVNRGDTVVIEPTSLDVTHGFALDGHPVEFIIKQQGIAYEKFSWKDEQGNTHADWDKVDSIQFRANRSGKFTFRCTQVCGNLHPFMTGELIVRPNSSYHYAVSLSIWLVASLLLWWRRGAGSGPKERNSVNLLHVVPGLKWLVQRRSLQFLLIFPGLVVFYLFLISSLFGTPVGNRNIAIIFIWILWWFALKALFVPLGGRLWCLICPLPAPAEWISRKSLTAVHYLKKPVQGLHHRFLGLQKKWPKPLRNMWLQNLIFMAMISFGIILITRPAATAGLLLAILAGTLVLALIYRGRAFCLYLCPVGGFLGNYSMASVTSIRAVDRDVCRKHRDKCCYTGGPDGWACPWNQYIGSMDRNNYCGFCTECIKSCPRDNVSIFLRPFGADTNLKGYDEMYNVIIMLVVAIAFSLTMLSPFGDIKEAANVTESGEIDAFLAYLGWLWGSALIVFPGLFLLASKGSQLLSRKTVLYKDLTLRLAYILIPVGIFAWIAFSLPTILVNHNYILVVLSDPLGLGWDLFGTADAFFDPFLADWIPLIQGAILLAGLYFGLSRGWRSAGVLIREPAPRVRAMLLPALYALVSVNILLKLYMG